MNVVFDANIVIAAVWRRTAYRCLIQMAKRRVFGFATRVIIEEIEDTVIKLEELKAFDSPPWPVVSWYLDRVKQIEVHPLGKAISRDPKDDEYIACALGAKAHCIVTQDKDLLILEKPFGIEIITPQQFLSELILRV